MKLTKLSLTPGQTVLAGIAAVFLIFCISFQPPFVIVDFSWFFLAFPGGFMVLLVSLVARRWRGQAGFVYRLCLGGLGLLFLAGALAGPFHWKETPSVIQVFFSGNVTSWLVIQFCMFLGSLAGLVIFSREVGKVIRSAGDEGNTELQRDIRDQRYFAWAFASLIWLVTLIPLAMELSAGGDAMQYVLSIPGHLILSLMAAALSLAMSWQYGKHALSAAAPAART